MRALGRLDVGPPYSAQPTESLLQQAVDRRDGVLVGDHAGLTSGSRPRRARVPGLARVGRLQAPERAQIALARGIRLDRERARDLRVAHLLEVPERQDLAVRRVHRVEDV